MLPRQDIPVEVKEEKSAGLTNTVVGYSVVKSTIQTRNSGEVVTVYNVLDDTEGLTPMDIFPFEPGSRNLDIGGGKSDAISEHLSRWYRVTNLVFDPYNRSAQHNAGIMQEVKKAKVDSVTSNSVLNVVLDQKERNDHIMLAYDSLKVGGIAFFKVWRGNGSGVLDRQQCQSNKEAQHYVGEIQAVFGAGNVELIKDDIGNTIFAYRR